jgi:alkane 1-monooxygenase
MRLRDLGYLTVFITASLPLQSACMMRAGMPADLAAWWPLLVIFGIVPLLDLAGGRELRNPIDPAEVQRLERQRGFRLLTWACLPVWLGLLTFCIAWFTLMPMGIAGQVGWLLSTGVIGGILAINVAHELIHKAGWLEPWLGGIALTSVGYPGFKIEHLRGHHVHVSTPGDTSSAARGESVYRFIARGLTVNPRTAWQLEAERLGRRGRSAWSLHNEMLRWWLLWLAMLVLTAVLSGFAGTAFFVAQGVVAASTLEVINYIEHYGLRRARDAQGRYERVTHLHSWNASERLTNWLLFQLQRHSDHHAHARRRYQVLLHHPDSPQLPAGYAAMFVLALIPPLWRKIMDPRVDRHQAALALDSSANPSP